MQSVVLLSGGVDSTVALAAVQKTARLALSFDYGQTHRKELGAARSIARHYGIKHHVIDISGALETPSALTGFGEIPATHAEAKDATFVPGRNLVMLSVATAWANSWGYSSVVIGANADDRAGYPDCTPSFIESISKATTDGYQVSVWAPLIRMTKEDIVKFGRSLNVPLDLTWSCYRGADMPCMNCGACEQKQKAGL